MILLKNSFSTYLGDGGIDFETNDQIVNDPNTVQGKDVVAILWAIETSIRQQLQTCPYQIQGQCLVFLGHRVFGVVFGVVFGGVHEFDDDLHGQDQPTCVCRERREVEKVKKEEKVEKVEKVERGRESRES